MGEDFHLSGAAPTGEKFAGTTEDLEEFDVDSAPLAEIFENGAAIFAIFARDVGKVNLDEMEEKFEVVSSVSHSAGSFFLAEAN